MHTVQMAHIFEDSKTFVDMKLKMDPEKVLADFDQFLERNEEPTPEQIREFVQVSLIKIFLLLELFI